MDAQLSIIQTVIETIKHKLQDLQECLLQIDIVSVCSQLDQDIEYRLIKQLVSLSTI